MFSKFKKLLKKSNFILTCVDNFRIIFWSLLFMISPILLAKYKYSTKMKKKLDLKNPKLFDEKLLWLMLNWKHPLKTRCADKYAMRSFVEECGLVKHLPILYGVYNNAKEIDFDILPASFVLKCTRGCGFNIICFDKKKLDKPDAVKKLNKWLKTDISKRVGEVHYASIEPKIICEEYIGDSFDKTPDDYKLYCFNGSAFCTMVCSGRFMEENTKFDFYDREWKNKLPFSRSSLLADRSVPKPKNFTLMIDIADKLSKPFPFVRVDLYSTKNKVYIGELTFTPNGCIDPGLTPEAQVTMGRLIQLPKKYL